MRRREFLQTCGVGAAATAMSGNVIAAVTPASHLIVDSDFLWTIADREPTVTPESLVSLVRTQAANPKRSTTTIVRSSDPEDILRMVAALRRRESALDTLASLLQDEVHPAKSLRRESPGLRSTGFNGVRVSTAGVELQFQGPMRMFIESEAVTSPFALPKSAPRLPQTFHSLALVTAGYDRCPVERCPFRHEGVQNEDYDAGDLLREMLEFASSELSSDAMVEMSFGPLESNAPDARYAFWGRGLEMLRG